MITHIGFADESHWNKGRFRSLGVVTLPLNTLDYVENEMKKLLNDSQVKEFKWKNCKGARERFVAEKLCEFAIKKACSGLFRVDVLVWDIEDSRHKISGRDDIANLERMYYHLFYNVLRARWPNDAVWMLCPDEHTALDWKTLQKCLEYASNGTKFKQPLFPEVQFLTQWRQEFRIEEIQEVSSDAHPLLQLSDLFAGLVVFSRDKYDDYQNWLLVTSQQLRLFNEGDISYKLSKSLRERFKILQKFDLLCKRGKMGVNLEKKRGLWTPDPQKPINFWMYEPQHPEDKAPRRKS